MKEIATPATQATPDIPYQRLQEKKLDPRLQQFSELMEKNAQLRQVILDLSSPRTPIKRIRYLERTLRNQGARRDVLVMFAKLRAFDESTL